MARHAISRWMGGQHGWRQGALLWLALVPGCTSAMQSASDPTREGPQDAGSPPGAAAPMASGGVDASAQGTAGSDGPAGHRAPDASLPSAPALTPRPETPRPGQNPYGAGLTEPLRLPDEPSGSTHSVLAAGATPDDASDDDGPAIGAALMAAKAGDEVLLPNGTYHVKTRRSIVLKSGVSLRGQSRAGVVIDAQFTPVKDNVGSFLIEAPPGTENLIVSGFTIRSTGGQPLRYAIWIGHDPAASKASRIEVRDLLITQFEKMAIGIRNATHVAIHHNVITEATATGGGGEGYGVMIGYPQSQNNWVAWNELLGPNLRHGVLIQYSAHHNLVEHNRAKDLVMDSYDLHGEDEHHNELRANVAEGSGEGGFGVGNTGGTPEHYDAGPFNFIHHNEVSGARYGIHIYRESHQTIVERNTFRSIKDIGIYIKNEGANGCRIVGNRVEMSNAGARFENARNLTMEDNVISGNTGYAMKVASTTIDYVIKGNDFRGNGGPVELGSSSGVFENNRE